MRKKRAAKAAKAGKPEVFDDAVFTRVLDAVAEGATVSEIVCEPWAPTRKSFYAWLEDAELGAANTARYEGAERLREITWRDDAVAAFRVMEESVNDPDPDKRPTKDQLTTARAKVTFIMSLAREARQERKAGNPVGRPNGPGDQSGDPADRLIVETVLFSAPDEASGLDLLTAGVPEDPDIDLESFADEEIDVE